MAYEGEILNYCMADMFDFSNAHAVVVTGMKGNFCGHLLLNTGGIGGTYFHVAGIRAYPKYMNESGYRRYLRENNKSEITRYRVRIPNPMASQLKLEELLAKKWTWLLLPNNCANFVEDVVKAGGSKAGLYFNCPRTEKFD